MNIRFASSERVWAHDFCRMRVPNEFELSWCEPNRTLQNTTEHRTSSEHSYVVYFWILNPILGKYELKFTTKYFSRNSSRNIFIVNNVNIWIGLFPSFLLGMGRVQTRPEARPEGVLGDPDPSRAIFGGPEVDPSKIFRTRNPFFFSKSLFSSNLNAI